MNQIVHNFSMTGCNEISFLDTFPPLLYNIQTLLTVFVISRSCTVVNNVKNEAFLKYIHKSVMGFFFFLEFVESDLGIFTRNKYFTSLPGLVVVHPEAEKRDRRIWCLCSVCLFELHLRSTSGF